MPGPYDKFDPNMMAGAAGGMMGRGPQGAFAAPEPMVPPGNPIAEHYQGRADELGSTAAMSGIGGGLLGGVSLIELLDGNPLVLPGLVGAGALAAYGGAASDLGQEKQNTANMWHNRFGLGDPNQGLPGTPSGPAWRK